MQASRTAQSKAVDYVARLSAIKTQGKFTIINNHSQSFYY